MDCREPFPWEPFHLNLRDEPKELTLEDIEAMRIHVNKELDADLVEELKEKFPLTSRVSLYDKELPDAIPYKFTQPKPSNTEIWITDDVVFMTYREKPFSWLQKKMLRWCFDWAIKVPKE